LENAKLALGKLLLMGAGSVGHAPGKPGKKGEESVINI
jgi:hypothetical protein